MRISVVMTTYNGEKYIKQQLESLRRQSLTPDEVLIFDDHSSDNTVDIISDYIQTHALHSNWAIHINEKNIGWRRNFRAGIEKCSGDIVFLCDQDDIWKFSKIEEMVSILYKNSGIELLVGDCYKIDEYSKLIGRSFDYSHKVKKLCFEDNWFVNNKPGCTYCFKRELYYESLQCDNDLIPHDAMLWIISIIRGTTYLYKRKLVYYRKHSNNASSGRGKSFRDKRIDGFKTRKLCTDVALEYCLNNDDFIDKIPLINKLVISNKLREEYITKRSFSKLTKNLIKNIHFYSGAKDIALDIYAMIK